ncbi:macro domain-containing protein [Rhodoferax saidenbachensis]|uniref:O-acetyl-ADP-ribose deacetylase (Regulator of RNase III) n=1 Tax=Rhodoferax saidenbachensis TaxID=1484693 RepID=A0ABU1ZPV7_9BURK|nr:macro domain-containing protein [Rhodoferax saidenbachensis]MDR7307592.1 O-acetyl-ADP-ribose deacetylase (regulator of RNase III) [Rhodoferax saidenbachensis]
MSIHLTHGDLLKQDDVDAIVNTVNCVGVMGKGIALQFKNKWPDNFTQYQAACKAGKVRPGTMHVYDAGAYAQPHFVINFPTKDHWRGNSKLSFIEDGLKDLIAQVQKLGIRSIAIPPLGCGNGGLNWADVKPMIEAAFAALPDVVVRLFEPGDAPSAKSMEVRTARPKMTVGRAAILKSIDTYRDLNYGLTKIEVQKLGYFLQVAGQDLGLKFEKHLYGPYSEQLRHALNRMEGHFIVGLGDGSVDSEIEPLADAIKEADEFLACSGDAEIQHRLARLQALIDGFQSPYGMELLSTVYWVAHHEPNVTSPDDALLAIGEWNPRKKRLMQSTHVRAAWDRLVQQSWIAA